MCSRHFPLPFKEGAPWLLSSFRKEAFLATPTFLSRSASFNNNNQKWNEVIAGFSSRSDSPKKKKKKKGNEAMEGQVPTESLSKVQKLSSNTVNGGTKHSLGFPALLVKKLSPHAILPSRGSALAAGYDLSSAYDDVVPARGKALVKTDLSIAIPEGTYARVAPRSGLAWKHAIDVGAGVIDADYRGSVGVILFNHSDQDFTIKAGDRIAQLILEKIAVPNVVEVDDLDATARGEGGFGSTGVNTTL